jgi:hypothetical protein
MLFRQLIILSSVIGASSFNSIASGADASYGAAPTNLKAYLDRLVSYYSDTISGYDDRFLISKNGKRSLISDNRTDKTFRELIETPDVDDMFYPVYPSGTVPKQPEKIWTLAECATSHCLSPCTVIAIRRK